MNPALPLSFFAVLYVAIGAWKHFSSVGVRVRPTKSSGFTNLSGCEVANSSLKTVGCKPTVTLHTHRHFLPTVLLTPRPRFNLAGVSGRNFLSAWRNVKTQAKEQSRHGKCTSHAGSNPAALNPFSSVGSDSGASRSAQTGVCGDERSNPSAVIRTDNATETTLKTGLRRFGAEASPLNRSLSFPRDESRPTHRIPFPPRETKRLVREQVQIVVWRGLNL